MADILCSRIRRRAFSTRAARSAAVMGCTPSSMGLSLRMGSGRSLCCAAVTPAMALARNTRRFILTRLPSMGHGVDDEIHPHADTQEGKLLRVARIVGQLPGVSEIVIEGDGHHDTALVVAN